MELTRGERSLRVEWSAAELDGLRNGFVGLYAAGSLVALPLILLFAPEAILGWAAFVVFLGVWTWQVRRVDIAPFVVEVDDRRFVRTWTGGEDRIDRAAVERVRRVTSTGPRTGSVESVRLLGHDGDTLVQVSLPHDARDAVLAAMVDLGWPVERRPAR